MNLQLENISFAYGDDTAISQVNAQFESGLFYAVIGPNGSGKTTLLDLMSGFLQPTSGTVRMNGTSLSQMPKPEIARALALVSQENQIRFSFKVKDILLMGRHPYIQRFSKPSEHDLNIVNGVMAQCRIDHLAHRRIDELSGGERQRCLFARSLCQDTPTLLLDEAFSHMDISHSLHLLHLVKQKSREKGTMVISVLHDLNMAMAWADKILVLKSGKMVEFGTPETTITERLISSVFDVSAMVDTYEKTGKRQVYYPAF